ncbi:MAG: hypothetical protein ACYC8T_04980 [Myxococcaceae bacterium]
MNETEPEESWLPTTEQILMASERAILAALDTNLLLAERTLRAEHADTLGEGTIGEPGPPHVALTECILILSASLRELIAGYRAATGRILRDD